MPICIYCYEDVDKIYVCPECHQKFCELHLPQKKHDCRGEDYLLDPNAI